jgi:hypothetical protein
MRGESGIYYDAVEAPHVEPEDDDATLRNALEIAYGDAWWIDLDRIVAEVRDADTDWDDALRFFFNHNTSGGSCPFDLQIWDELAVTRDVSEGSRVGLGFDGSITQDRTCLYGCAFVPDAKPYLFKIATWARPVGVTDWHVPRLEVHAALEEAFTRWNCYLVADPPRWWSELDQWTERWPDRVEALDTNQARRFAPECDRLATEIRERAVEHDGSPDLLAALAACARKKVRLADDDDDGRSRFVIVKADARKIDDAVAGILARTALSHVPETATMTPMIAWR